MTESTNLAFWTAVLNINGCVVVNHSETDQAHRFKIAPPVACCCPDCGGHCVHVQKRQANRPIADLPILGKKVWLVLRRDQFRCTDCGKRFTPANELVSPMTWVTPRLMNTAAEQIRYSDVASTARSLDIPETSLGRWYNQYLEREQIDIPPPIRKPIKALGIDELALKKRHRQFVAVIVDHTNRCVLEVLETRTKADVIACLTRLKAAGLFDELEEVSCDMWGPYESAVREVFGSSAKVCVDRFHVMKAFQDQLTQARREIQRELPDASKQELKGSRWCWVKNWENLCELSRKQLMRLKKMFPRLGQLHDQREKLRQIFEREQSVESGRKSLLLWIEQARTMGLAALDAFCGTLERWMDEIVQYFYRRTTNGRTEGFNRGLRSVIWRACGMQNFKNFRLRVLHAYGPCRPESRLSHTDLETQR